MWEYKLQELVFKSVYHVYEQSFTLKISSTNENDDNFHLLLD